MKKKILSLCLVVAMVATAVVGASMAYLTDTDEAVNVMTLGNVDIEQHEYERVVDANGTYEMVTSDKYGEGYKLQEFTQAKPLYPATGAITGWGTIVPFDQIEGASGSQAVFAGLNNVQDKFVLVENTGKSDAYVRTLIALEYGTNEKDIIGISTGDFWTWNGIGIVEIDGNNYYVFEAVYNGSDSRHIGGVLPAGEYTYNSLGQIYLKNEATNEDCEALDGNDNGTYDILVLSQAVQVEGFADAKTALDTAFGNVDAVNVQSWFGGMVVPEYVTEDVNSTDTGYGIYNDAEETTIVNGANIVTKGGGVNVKGTVVFNSGSVVTNSTSTSGRHVFYVWPGGQLTINGGEFTFSPTNLTRKGYYICAHGEGATVIVNGGTFHKPSTRTDYSAGIGEIEGGKVIIYGGTFAFDPSNWVAEGYQAVESDGWWTVSTQ